MKCYVRRYRYYESISMFVDNELIDAVSKQRHPTDTTTKNHLDWYFTIGLGTAKDVSIHKFNPKEENIFSKTLWEF